MPRLSRRRFLEFGTAAAGAAILTKSTGAAGVTDTKVEYIKIHPAIGVARVGNSPEGFFIGPEVVEPVATTADSMRDREGALKRQAARFRVYAYNKSHQVIREITGDETQLNWQVHMANKKAEWFRFIAAMDMKESETLRCQRRNVNVRQRDTLIIDPGAKAIEGRNARTVQLDGGKFLNEPVNLGELRTDEKGRLLVLGGKGRAQSIPGNLPPYNPQDPDTFNNADGWFDDTGDGPVRVTVSLNGQEFKSSAWVITAPPNYAPDVIGWRTMYDMLVDCYAERDPRNLPRVTSFTHDVLPILRRLSGLQWVNQGFEEAFGHNDTQHPNPPSVDVCKQPDQTEEIRKACRIDFDNKSHISQLAAKTNPASNQQTFRANVLKRFRISDNKQNRRLWPMMYGDAYGTYDNSDDGNLSVSRTRSIHLKNWVDGNYDDDFNNVPAAPVRKIEDLTVERQPAMLDRSALHYCLADAFHPGCELTWPMRHLSMFDSNPRNPFRIKERNAAENAPAFASHLTHRNYKDYLQGQTAGDLTKWMAVPWQGDTIFCRSGYEPEFDPYIPTYWPARVPNHVLSEADYEIVKDTAKPLSVRIAAYKRRKFWTRNITGSAPQQIHQMVTDFSKMGIIEVREGFANDANFPTIMLVESLPMGVVDKSLEMAGSPRMGGARRARNLPGEFNDPISQAGWESPEQLEEFRNIRSRRRPR